MPEGAEKSDEQLMAAYMAGDQEAFRGLFQRHEVIVKRMMARGLSRTEIAGDLTQQAFLHLHRSRLDFREGAMFRPWFYTIAMNLKREHLRRLKRRPEAALEAGESRLKEGPRGADQVDARRTLDHAMKQLPRDQREVIELHWLEGMPFPEVADVVGASVGAVKVRAHRGYQTLRKVLETEPLESPSAPE